MESPIKFPNISPEASANFVSKILFCWVLPFLKYGANHTILNRDIYDTLDVDLASKLTEELERNWNYELKRSRVKNREPCLRKALFFSFGHWFLIYGLFLFIQSTVIRVLHPIVLAEYIKHFQERNSDAAIGYYFATAIVVLAFFNILIYHHCFFGCARIGIRAKIACSSLIQKKVLKLSQYSINRTSPRRVVKLLSEDVKKIESVSPYLHYLYISPLQFLASTYILLNIIGISSLAGLLFMVLISAPQAFVSTLQRDIKDQLSIHTGCRVKIMQEILYGIRIIKMYGWEKPFEKLMAKASSNELKLVSKQTFIKCFSISTVMFAQTIAVFLTLTTHVLIGNELSAEVVFATVLIYYNLQQYIFYFFPEAIERYQEANPAIFRIENFLTMEEKEEQMRVISYVKEYRKPGTIRITDASVRWGNQTVLQGITIKIGSGKSCCIFGPPGSGKTSFMNMILKELPAISGRVDIVGSISYASQKPWLFPSTIKNNILFGQPYNRHKYREIIKICSLVNDFQKLPSGDQTLVNHKLCKENGIRHKINLARSVYKDADIYIIDDLFGPNDYQTDRFIFSECIMKYLKNKTKIYVSNKIYYAKEADTIVVLENGAVNRIIEKEDFTEEDHHYLSTKLSMEKNNFTSSGLANFIDETELNSELEHQEMEVNIDNRGYLITLEEFLKLPKKKYIVEVVVMLVVFMQIFSTLSDYWLVQWVDEEPRNISEALIILDNVEENKTSSIRMMYNKIIHDVLHGLDDKNLTVQEKTTNKTNKYLVFGVPEKDFYICCYAGFITCSIIFMFVGSLLYHTMCMNASRVLYNTMFNKVLFSPIQFFETFPSGRILQRFSKDMDVVHNLTPKNFITWQMYSALCGTILLILFTAPATIPPLMLIFIMVYFLISAYVSNIRNLQKLANNSQHPIYAFLRTSFYGIFTIRSAVAEELIVELFENLLDKDTGIWSLILTTSEYFCFYMDFIAVLFMGIITFLVLIVKIETYHSGYVGLAVTQGLILTELLHLGIRESIEALCSNSTLDRTLHYTKLVTENVDKCTLVPKNWPFCGKIVFKNVFVKHNNQYGSFLKNLNISIKPSEKIAVVSRYSEEKWTIMNCLLRLIPVEGLVVIDDVDTSNISLNKLRSSVTVITKDPILFTASVRYNLDPLDYANDDMLWRVLDEVGLKMSIQSLSQPIIEGGFNFSCGQRQLLCLARALLRNTKILVIENDLPNIDPRTENCIQKLIREKFKHCTVITIANSLNTVMDNDKLLVIEEGKEVEYAHAHELLQNSEGYLSYLVRETGPQMEENLKTIAKENFDARNLEIQFRFDNGV